MAIYNRREHGSEEVDFTLIGEKVKSLYVCSIMKNLKYLIAPFYKKTIKKINNPNIITTAKPLKIENYATVD